MQGIEVRREQYSTVTKHSARAGASFECKRTLHCLPLGGVVHIFVFVQGEVNCERH